MFARAMGMRRIAHDRLIGLVVLADTLDEDRGWLTVDASPFGWWYTVEVPEHGRLVALMTDADIARETGAKTADGFHRLLSSTKSVGCCTASDLTRAPIVVAASTSRLSQIVGAGWCAAGDACATYDPLSSQGIVNAMTSGRAAAQVALSGDSTSYAESAEQSFAKYLATRRHVYSDNSRWPDMPFWRRRVRPDKVFAH